jgi:hypothetical protein
MKNKALPIAVSAVAVALVAVIAVLGIKMSNGNPSSVPAKGSVYSDSIETQTPSEKTTVVSETTEAETVSEERTSEYESTSAISQPTTQTEATSVTQSTTKPATTISNKAFKEVFTLPQAPKYIPPTDKIDFSAVNLASYKYDPDGNYYYTDDKECWQKNFGFNEVYDTFAPITMMYYDTVRTTFEYGGKEWLIQTWKGQYGMAFVGGEVGVYTRNPNLNVGSHFVCADKADWLNMEMAFMWDEYETGDYRAVFNRDYDKYWWATGFVVGFPNGSLRKTLSEFRLVTHITFKDAEMADAFCEAFEENGFKRVSKLNNNEPDTFVQVGSDVAFVWQNINHK